MADEIGYEIYNDGEIQGWRYSYGVEISYLDSGEGVTLTNEQWMKLVEASNKTRRELAERR